jgi:hypothetical protein
MHTDIINRQGRSLSIILLIHSTHNTNMAAHVIIHNRFNLYVEYSYYVSTCDTMIKKNHYYYSHNCSTLILE